jgi:Resolvase, N terminal domain
VPSPLNNLATRCPHGQCIHGLAPPRWHLVHETLICWGSGRSCHSTRTKYREARILDTRCRLQGAKLIIAKLDRLARNVAFISKLMESKVEFEAVDFPQANRLTIHIMAAIAEHEAKMISGRTRAALAAAKARGKRLGGFRGRAGTAADCAKARRAKSLAATSRAADLAPVIEDIRSAGANSLRSIAKELNEREISAPRGGVWSAAQVRAALARMPASR